MRHNRRTGPDYFGVMDQTQRKLEPKAAAIVLAHSKNDPDRNRLFIKIALKQA